MKVILYAQKPFWNLSEEEKKDICNGIGARGAWYNFLIPPSIKRLFKPSGDIHDYDYFVGKTQEDKEVADRRFNQNNQRIVDAIKHPVKKFLAKRAARSMYIAVDKLGNEAYWKDKIVDKQNSKGKETEI